MPIKATSAKPTPNPAALSKPMPPLARKMNIPPANARPNPATRPSMSRPKICPEPTSVTLANTNATPKSAITPATNSAQQTTKGAPAASTGCRNAIRRPAATKSRAITKTCRCVCKTIPVTPANPKTAVTSKTSRWSAPKMNTSPARKKKATSPRRPRPTTMPGNTVATPVPTPATMIPDIIPKKQNAPLLIRAGCAPWTFLPAATRPQPATRQTISTINRKAAKSITTATAVPFPPAVMSKAE